MISPLASAQFGSFDWTLGGDPAGFGSLTSSAMTVTSNPGNHVCAGNPPGVTHYTTTAPFPGTVTATVTFDNQDTCLSFWHFEHPVYLKNGLLVVIGGDDACFDQVTQFSFEVEAGDTFGFGSWSVDCTCEPGLSIFHDFTFQAEQWANLGVGIAGTGGVVPSLIGFGTLSAGNEYQFKLFDAASNTTAYLIARIAPLNQPFLGGVLIPNPGPPGLVLPLPIGPQGRIVIEDIWPPNVPAGVDLYLQYFIVDPAGPVGFSASNAVTTKTE